MTIHLDKIKKFIKEHEKITKIAKILSSHSALKSDDDKVLEAADEM